MARRYGNAGSVSSLISSARAAYEREQSYQDQIATYEWDLSAKTAEDHDKYVAYLAKRQKDLEVRDPAKALTVAGKINSARSTFASKEIQRASIQINYGNGTDSDKYTKMLGLYQGAVQNGDYDLAQNLEAQLGTLQIKIMNAQQAAANAASAASDKAYAAIKKGVETQLTANKNLMPGLEEDFRTGKISRTEYLTDKKKLLMDRENILKSAVGVQADGTVTNPLGLKQEDFDKYANDMTNLRNSNPNYFGKMGNLLDRGLSPFDVVRDPNSDSLRMVDRAVGGYSWNGGTSATPGTIAAPDYVDSNSLNKDEIKKTFEQLGFKGGKVTDKGYEMKLEDGNTIVYAQIKDVNGRKIAIFKDPRSGSLNQVIPGGKSAPLISSNRAGGSDYYSVLMDQQNKISTSEADKQFAGLGGVARVSKDAAQELVAATGKTFDKIKGAVGSQLNGNGKLGLGNSIQQVADKSMQILGLRKRAEEKAAQERAAWAEQQKYIAATQAAANNARAEQAARAAAQAGSTAANVGALRYDFTTGKVINGGYGAPAIPKSVQKSANTPGTTDFAKKYILPRGY